MSINDLVGKTIGAVEGDLNTSDGGCDWLTVTFTDGTKLGIVACWCNDGGASLAVRLNDVEVS